MPADNNQVLCEDCVKRKSCDYVPADGTLIRCLDRETAGSDQPQPFSTSFESGRNVRPDTI